MKEGDVSLVIGSLKNKIVETQDKTTKLEQIYEIYIT